MAWPGLTVSGARTATDLASMLQSILEYEKRAHLQCVLPPGPTWTSCASCDAFELFCPGKPWILCIVLDSALSMTSHKALIRVRSNLRDGSNLVVILT